MGLVYLALRWEKEQSRSMPFVIPAICIRSWTAVMWSVDWRRWFASLTVELASNSVTLDVGVWIISGGNMCGLVGDGAAWCATKRKLAKITRIAPQNDPLPDTSASQNHNMQIGKTDFHEAGSEDNKNKWSLETSEREPPAFIVGIKILQQFLWVRNLKPGTDGRPLVFAARCHALSHITCSAFICSFVLLVLRVWADVKTVIGTPVSAKQPKVVKSHF